jgi:hypothetical protein
MGHFSVEISRLPGSVLSGNQHRSCINNQNGPLVGSDPSFLKGEKFRVDVG